jgi:predicted Fe-Mo cluster-binding NifX family protein
MKIGITLDDNKGLKSRVCLHFGQCGYFLIVEVKDKKIVKHDIVPNCAQHGGGACLAVDEILKYKITHMIAGGMGINAQLKLANAGVKVFNYSGIAEDAVKELIAGNLGDIEPCKGHEV